MLVGIDDIVPFAMKTARFQIDAGHLFGRDFPAGQVFAAIQATSHPQSFGGGGAGDQTHDGFIIAQGFPAPVGGDKGEQAVFHLVPLAGSRRKVAHRN